MTLLSCWLKILAIISMTRLSYTQETPKIRTTFLSWSEARSRAPLYYYTQETHEIRTLTPVSGLARHLH